MTILELRTKIQALDEIIKEHFNGKPIHTDAFIRACVKEREELCLTLNLKEV